MWNNIPVFVPEEETGNRALRSEETTKQTVTVGSDTFDAREIDMDRMDRVVDIANWQYNRAVANGTSPADAYAQIYQNTTIPWKTADNVFGNFPIETICEAQEKALNQLASIWQSYG